MPDRLIQLFALLFIAGGLIAGALLSPGIKQQRLAHQYTYETQAGDSTNPQYTLLASTGSLRGIAINVAWYRIEKLKEEGKFAEANDLAKFVTSLQPRFPAAWEFMAWNMAYNISVKCNTQEERWYWVRNGMDLLRNEGIPNNPRAILLYRQLGWILSHKIAGRTDDMHWYYKRQFAQEWEEVLGAPLQNKQLIVDEGRPEVPRSRWHELTPDRFSWWSVGQFRDVEQMAQTYLRREDTSEVEWTPEHYFTALSPDTLRRFYADYPGTEGFVSRLRGLRGQAGEPLGLGLNAKTLRAWGRIEMLRRAGYNLADPRIQSREMLGDEALAIYQFLSEANDPARVSTPEQPRYGANPRPRSDGNVPADLGSPSTAERLVVYIDPLLDLLRAQALIADYHMDPAYMRWLMDEYGPLDWRHPQSHALYWSSLGTLMAASQVNRDRIDVLNNDRQKIHAIQGLTYNGTLFFRPKIEALGAQGEGKIFTMADPRFIEAYDRALTQTRELVETGIFGDLNTDHFQTGYENFLHSAIQLSWYGGQTGLARRYWDKVRAEFDTDESRSIYKAEYELYDLPTFAHFRLVDDNLLSTYNSQVLQLLVRAWHEGMIQREPEVTARLIRSAQQLYDKFVEEFGNVATPGVDTQHRMLLGSFEDLLVETFVPVITDPTYSLQERATMWGVAAQLMPDAETRFWAYNRMIGPLSQQIQSQGYDLNVTEAFGMPRGYPEWLERQRQQQDRNGAGPGILRQ